MICVKLLVNLCFIKWLAFLKIYIAYSGVLARKTQTHFGPYFCPLR